MRDELQDNRIIQTLEQDLPTLFEKDISYDIYTKDIFFKDPVNTSKGKFKFPGKDSLITTWISGIDPCVSLEEIAPGYSQTVFSESRKLGI